MTNKLKLRPSVKTKWLAALRSGKYKQTSNRLRNAVDDSFCCLGVLCNLHAEDHPKFAATQTHKGTYDGHNADLSQRVLDWAFEKRVKHFTDALVNIDHPTYDSLAALNDSGKYSFKKIATVIEKKL